VLDIKRGTSLRYPLKEKKRITHNLTVHSSRASQFNGVDHKKSLSESLSAATIQSEREVSVDDHSDYNQVTNGPNLSLRRRVLKGVSSEDDTAGHVVKAGSLEDVRRASGGHRPSVASRTLSLPVKDVKTVTMPSEKLKYIDKEFLQLRDTPALRFLTRKDLYKYMTSAGVSLMLIVIVFQMYLNYSLQLKNSLLIER